MLDERKVAAKSRIVVNTLNITTETYFDNKILERFQGLISNSLIVPQENSPATESAAITTTNIMLRKKETVIAMVVISQTFGCSDPDERENKNGNRIEMTTNIAIIIHVRIRR
jgi:hypothetical protein